MKLVIAEKPELGKNIAHAVCGAPKGCRLPYEGNGYRVVACAGHILQLMEPSEIDEGRYGDRRDLSVLPILPKPWPKKVTPGKEDLYRTIERALRGCDAIVNAGDPDDEGQLLIDEVIERLGWTGPVERVYINDNIDRNIVRAFEKLTDNGAARADGEAALARSLADFCFGINESRLIAAKAGAGVNLTVGRVQTPTLGLVVRRDEEIMGHVAAEYYVATASVEVDGEGLQFAFKPAKELLGDDGKRCYEKAALEAATAALDGTSGTCETSVERKKYPAPLPYNLTDLTADMSKRYKMGAKRVLDATQGLRDKHRAITYNRSDCNYLPCEAHDEAPAVLARAMGNIGRSWDLDYSICGRAFNDELITAHTGIIPQDEAVDVKALSEDERRVYEAIVERYAMQFMPEAEADVSVTRIACGKGALEHRAKRPVAQGWKAIRAEKDDDERGLQEGWLDAGTHRYTVCGHRVEAKRTKPKPPYTEGTLAKDMSSIAKYVRDPEMRETLKRKDAGKRGEHGGIGTTATRAAIIEGLKKKGYIEERSGKLISTPLGRQVYHACPESIRGADLTARWWLMCEDVRAGKLDPYAVADSVCEEFERHRDTAYEGVKITRASTATEVAKCPLCGGRVVDRGPKWKKVSCASNEFKKGEDGTWTRTAGCGFELWKTVAGKKLTDRQLGDLITKGRTAAIRGFKSKAGKEFSAALVLEDAASGKVSFRFEQRDGKGMKKGR